MPTSSTAKRERTGKLTESRLNVRFFSPAVGSKWPSGCEPLNSQENRMFSGAAASSRVRHFYCRSGTVAAVAVTAAATGEEQ